MTKCSHPQISFKYKFLKAFKNLYLDEKLNFNRHIKEIKEMSKATKEIVAI